MTFKEGDEVFVVDIDRDSMLYVKQLEEFVNNGQSYKVHKGPDFDGDILVDTPNRRWYFKPEWLKLASEVDAAATTTQPENPYLKAVGVHTREVTTYTYDGYPTFDTRGKLLVHVFHQIVAEFPANSLGITAENIDIHIKKMQQLKELCQKIN